MPLELKGVSFEYGAGQPWRQQALSAVSLTVAPGELVLVVGPTGSGKSTLLRLAAGLLEPSGGDVLIDGEAAGSPRRRRQVGVVFQDPETQLFAETVLDDVAFGPSNLGSSKAQARQMASEALTEVGLDPAVFAERSPFGLSGGEARRAALAGIIAMRPTYLLADEPTAGLDASGKLAVGRILEDLRSQTGIVVVTHDAEEFLGSADRVLVLVDGRTVFLGTVEELLASADEVVAAGAHMPPIIDVQARIRQAGLPLAGTSLEPRAVAASIARAVSSGEACGS